MCGLPLTGRVDQRACSYKCRAALHRRRRIEDQARRDAGVRRLLEAALRELD